MQIVGGTDPYANAISDIYQDNFNEGSFIGKGIYDLKVFHEVFANEIPEQTVLSHDLLEGNYLRAGLASDILLLDGSPEKYGSFIDRLSRWIRGDWQISGWLKRTIVTRNGEKKKNPLNLISRFKILDNLRRSLIPISVFFSLILAVVFQGYLKIKVWLIITIAIFSYTMPTVLNILNYIIFKKDINRDTISAYKNITPKITELNSSIIRSFFELIFLPNKAYISTVAIGKTIYRMHISKEHLLEWQTAEEAELKNKTDIASYYKKMFFNPLLGSMCILVSYFTWNIYLAAAGILWITAPFIAWYISKNPKNKKNVKRINKEQKQYLMEIGCRTWQFFNEYISEENNFLPPDNYQEDRSEQTVKRTSSTNIGLALLSVISAYDLGYIELEKAIDLLERMLSTINKLQKWNGHLYNWYNTSNLEPLNPRFVSTVDSGNFVGYLYVLKQFLIEITKREYIHFSSKLEILIKNIDNLIANTQFSYLYSQEKRLFSIGFSLEENRLIDSYYDLLASEARQTSLVAIAKKDVPTKHWNNLSRTLTSLKRYKGLVSWSGTAFEYLMPNVNVRKYEGSLLDESCRFIIMSQKEYAKKLGIPWGISEAAFNLRDLDNNYQYRAFGIPWLGFKRGLKDDMVVSPYSVFLSMEYIPNGAIKNLKKLEEEGLYDKYGFYESIDYTLSRLKQGQTSAVVKTYMAHHQALILLSINNLINNQIILERFSKNPEIEAIDILLQEKMPTVAIITKEKKEKVEKLKLKNFDSYTEKVYTKIQSSLKRTNVISNGKYTIVLTERGIGYSKYQNTQVNRFKETADVAQGIFFYIKNVKNKKIWTNTNIGNGSDPDKYVSIFSPGLTKFKRQDSNIETITKIIVAPNDPVEIRSLEVSNNGNLEEILEITSVFEPILSSSSADYMHTAFNNLFLTFEEVSGNKILIKRRKRGANEKDIYMCVSLYTEDEAVTELEYEIDREKFFGNGNFDTPELIIDSKPYSRTIGLVTDPILAMKRTLKIKPNQKVIVNLIISIGESAKEVEQLASEFENSNVISKTFELVSAKTEAENIYLGFTSLEIEKYQKMMTYLLLQNPMKKLELRNLPKAVYSQSNLWKYGISRGFSYSSC